VESNRRRADRVPTSWLARYALDGADWCPCRVIDLSTGGAALEVLGPAPAVGDAIRVEIKLASQAVGVTLRCVARNVAPASTGTRVGLEWTTLNVLERDILALLVQRQPAVQPA
jgi:hypothetical protein